MCAYIDIIIRRVILIIPCIFFGCASQPPNALNQARQALERVKSNENTIRSAPVEVHEAEKVLSRAEQVWKDDQDADEVTHLSYQTQRQLELAELKTDRKLAEQELNALNEQRKQLILEARAREAMLAKDDAEKARLQALEEARKAQEEAMRAREALERAKQLEAQLAELQAKKTERGVEITLGDILFEFAKADLKPGAMQRLYRLVTVLRENTNRNVVIEGHTDNVGSDQYNLDLSERRAQSVSDFLTDNGIEPERITPLGYGEEYPVATNKTAEGRQQNRRVEIIILNEGETPEDILRR